MSKVKDSIYGFVIGDALGCYCEFNSREALLANPVTEMKGYGSHDVPEGTWTDDSSMTFATMDSIINKKCIDPFDIMTNFYYLFKESRYTANDYVVGAGRTCLKAVAEFSKHLDIDKCGQTDIECNGNGSLMRMLPIVLYCYYKKPKAEEIYEIVRDTSKLTHAHEISIMGCYIYVRFLLNIMNGKDKEESYKALRRYNYSKYFSQDTIKEYDRILKNDISKYKLNEIKSTGYVVDTLEAVLFVVMNSTKFSESIIGAVNLGDDTDTIGAITGSITGTIYGYDEIPVKWLFSLKKQDYIADIVNAFEETMEKEDCPYFYNYWNVRFDDHHNNSYRKQLIEAGVNIEDKYLNRDQFIELFDTIIDTTAAEIIIKPIEKYMLEIDHLNGEGVIDRRNEEDIVELFNKLDSKEDKTDK